jgi:hypothetical protein
MRTIYSILVTLLVASTAVGQITESPIAHLSRAEGIFYMGAGNGRCTTLQTTANGRSLISAADYAAMKTLLAYGTMADQNANAVAITGGTLSGLSDVTLGSSGMTIENPTLKLYGYDIEDSSKKYATLQVDDGGRCVLTSQEQVQIGPIVGASGYIYLAPSAVFVVSCDLNFQSNTKGIKLGSALGSSVTSDASNLKLTDPTTGTKTLAQLATDTDTLGAISSVANGDVLIYNSGWTRLAKGDNGQVLKLASGLPSWAADTDTDTTYTAGDGIELTGTDFDLDLKSGGGLEIDTGELKVTAALLTGEIGLSWHGTAAEVIDDAVVCPYSGTITSVIITANTSGSIELDVWKSASGVPTVADTICNASYPALSAAQQDKAISVAGWSSTAITAGDTIKFEVRSVSTITQATVQLVIAK